MAPYVLFLCFYPSPPGLTVNLFFFSLSHGDSSMGHRTAVGCHIGGWIINNWIIKRVLSPHKRKAVVKTSQASMPVAVKQPLSAATVQVLLLTILAKAHDGQRKYISCALFHLPSWPFFFISLLSSQPKNQNCFVASVRSSFAFVYFFFFLCPWRIEIFYFDSVTWSFDFTSWLKYLL